MERYLRKTDKARCLAAGLLLRYAFGEEDASRITADSFGKPCLPEGPFFNLSHSGDKVVLLVSDRPSGVDIEQIAPWSEAVAKRVFTPKEQKWLEAQSGTDAFYRLWTAKESIMKALGLGFRLPPESFEVSTEENVPNSVCARDWYLRWAEIDGHILCCAADTCFELKNLRELFLENLLK
ncbi:MAG: 4'-phosphopantetheinyl transferase superfamily protein [Clostridia bacterium]|nr:4'-phosphopantetheinyl transferase superfamily protein [Clostridia bacterium]